MNTIQNKQEKEYELPYHHISKFRGDFSQCFNDTWGINYVATIEFLLLKLKKEDFNSLIDIGCGDGRLTLELFRDFRKKSRIVGVDLSEKAIRQAKAVVDADLFYCMDITKDSIDKFDVALLIEVFEHIDPRSAEGFIRGVCEQLVDDGILYMTVPHENKPVEYKHYRHFSVASVSKEFEKYFDILEIIPFESNHVWKRILDVLLTNRFFILNHKKLKNLIYRLYKQNLFYVDSEKNANRIFIKAKKKCN